MFKKLLLAATGLLAAAFVSAEQHTVTWTNSCPWSVQPVICSNSIGGYCWYGPWLGAYGAQTSYTHQGSLIGFISYGNGNGHTCGTNGEGCLITEGTLQDLSPCWGCNSVDLSLIPPHSFNFGNSFGFSDNVGAHGCEDPNCWSAFHQDGNDGVYQIQSNGWDISIGIDYCNGGGNF